MLSEKGTLKDTPVMKLLLTIYEQSMTGILYVKNLKDDLKVLYFSRGKLTWAISNSDKDKLENILVSRNQVEYDVLMKVKKEARVSDSIGKLLVEKGLITLEELIESSREQLKGIITSIMQWKDGGFQFVKDTPPERLISLDLNITDFIIQYILDEVDVSEIWKTIGSLQVEFIKNPDREKIDRYHLSLKQQQLLDGFTGDIKLEAVLSRYSGGHRESLLKIIYFFLVSELLIKKEFDLSDSAEFDDDGFDFIEEEEKASPGFQDYEPAKLNTESAEAKKDSYMFGDLKDKALEDEVELSKEALSKPMVVEEEKEGEKKSMKMITWVLVSITLILGGVVLLMLLEYLNDTPKIDQLMKPPPGDDIIKIEEKKDTPEESRKEDKKEDKTEEVSEQIPLTAGDTKTVEKETPEVPKEKEPVKQEPEKPKPKKQEKKAEKQYPPGKSAQQYFREGNMITAGDIWKQELRKSKARYTILLELDCLKESVMHAYGNLTDKSDFFILNRKSGRRNCYLVLFGRYRTRESARLGIKKIPKYFWQQSNPPEVIELGPYLK